MAFPYSEQISQVSAQFPTAVMTPQDIRNHNLNGTDLVENFTVPAAVGGLVRINLDQVPLEKVGMVITSDGDELTIIPWGETPAIDQVAVSMKTGALQFHSSRVGESATAEYRGKGTPLMGHVLNKMQREIEAAQTRLAEERNTEVITPQIRNATSGGLTWRTLSNLLIATIGGAANAITTRWEGVATFVSGIVSLGTVTVWDTIRGASGRNVIIGTDNGGLGGNNARFLILESGSSDASAGLTVQHAGANSGTGPIVTLGSNMTFYGAGRLIHNGTSVTNPTNFEASRWTMRAAQESGDLVIDTIAGGTGVPRNIVIAPATGILRLRGELREARHEVVTVTGNVTLTQAQSNAQIVVTNGASIVTLPTAPLEGTTYPITWASATVTGSVTRGGSFTINGAGYSARTSITPVPQGSVTLRYAGGNWRIISMQGAWT